MTPMVFFILVVISVLSCALGAFFGYLYFKARYRESAQRLEAMWEQFIEQRRNVPRSAFADRPAGQASDKSEEVERLRSELENRMSDFRALKKKSDAETKALKNEINQLKVQLAGTGQEQQRLEHAAAELDRKRNDLQSSLRKAEAQGAEFDEFKKKALAERANLEEALRQLETERTALRQQLESKQGALQERIQAERTELQQQLESERAALQDTLRRMEADRATLQASMSRMESERAALQESLSRMESERTELESAIGRMEKERTDLRDAVSRMESERAEISERWADLERRRAELNAEEDRIRLQATKVDDEIMSLPEGRFSSRQEALLIKRLRQEIKTLRDEIESLHAQHERAA